MQIDLGSAVIVITVLIFYLRLIIIQRERAKRLRRQPPASPQKKKGVGRTQAALDNYSILSRKRTHRIIAALGVVAILIGAGLYLNILPFARVQEYAWLPIAAGILAFSWGFE